MDSENNHLNLYTEFEKVYFNNIEGQLYLYGNDQCKNFQDEFGILLEKREDIDIYGISLTSNFSDGDDVFNEFLNQLEKEKHQNQSSKKKGRRGRSSQPDPNWVDARWRVEHKKRKNGRIDKYYHHKELGFQCRSLVEAERFEKYGILPPSYKPRA